mgnify:CR=1 FL=1
MNHFKKITIIGAGSWGTTIAQVIAENHPSIRVTLWAYEKKVAHDINTHHINMDFLPEILLSDSISATNSLKDAVKGAGAVILAVPSKVIYDISLKLSTRIPENCALGYLSKGFFKVDDSIYTISQTIEKAIPFMKNKTVAISGPSHAEEVAHKYHTCLNIGGFNAPTRYFFSWLLSNEYIICRETQDRYGVDIGGTLKNPAAIAAGMLSALPNCGDNLQGALIAESLKEMIQLSNLFNAQSNTILDISGLGDLVTTALSEHSRNRRFGRDIAKRMLKKQSSLHIIDRVRLKLHPEKIIEKMSKDLHYLAEGAYAIEPIIEFAQKNDIAIPVYRSLYEVLVNKKNPSLLIETIKNPDKFEEIYRSTKITILERKKGLERVKGSTFKEIIIKKTIEQFETDIRESIHNDREIIISELKHLIKNKKYKPGLRETVAIRGMTKKNFSNVIDYLSRVYIGKIADRFNGRFKWIFLKYLKFCDYFNKLFNKKERVKNSGEIDHIKKIKSSENIIYVSNYQSFYDFIYLIFSINKQNLPFPRFFINKKAVKNKFDRMVLKLAGGFIVDEKKTVNIVYRECLCQYISTLIAHGVPLLFFPEKGFAGDSDIHNNFFKIVSETIYKHTVEIAFVPMEITYPEITEKPGKRRISFMKLFKRSPHINFSTPLYLSEYTREHSLETLPDKLQSIWDEDVQKLK